MTTLPSWDEMSKRWRELYDQQADLARSWVDGQAKLAGTRQLAHVVTGTIPRPVPPGAQVPFGGHDLTCGRCHQPMNIPGDVIRVKREYADD